MCDPRGLTRVWHEAWGEGLWRMAPGGGTLVFLEPLSRRVRILRADGIRQSIGRVNVTLDRWVKGS